MSEFSLIDKYFRKLGCEHDETRLGVGDDGAVLAVPEGKQLLVSVDTMVEGIHFLNDVAPEKLAHKLLAVNVSDIAAMGGTSKWATLALTLPKQDDDWLKSFSHGLDVAAKHFGVELVGGDTTRGPLTLSLQIMGLVDSGKALLRSGAQNGDAILVTGSLGDAALALSQLQNNISPTTKLLSVLEQPEPPIEFATQLAQFASSAIDVSDGLLADLGHIARASEVSMRVNVDTLPLSDEYLKSDAGQALALSGGDDYQLAFTAPLERLDKAFAEAQRFNIRLTQIGEVIAQQADLILVVNEDGKIIVQSEAGYDHFTS